MLEPPVIESGDAEGTVVIGKEPEYFSQMVSVFIAEKVLELALCLEKSDHSLHLFNLVKRFGPKMRFVLESIFPSALVEFALHHDTTSAKLMDVFFSQSGDPKMQWNQEMRRHMRTSILRAKKDRFASFAEVDYSQFASSTIA
jgi:hypothetical protein